MNKPQNEWIQEVGQEIIQLLIKKDKDYGNSFGDQYKDYGLLSGVIRLDDKLKRIKNLYKTNQSEVEESIDDTLMDIAGYAIMTLIERRKEQNRGG